MSRRLDDDEHLKELLGIVGPEDAFQLLVDGVRTRRSHSQEYYARAMTAQEYDTAEISVTRDKNTLIQTGLVQQTGISGARQTKVGCSYHVMSETAQ